MNAKIFFLVLAILCFVSVAFSARVMIAGPGSGSVNNNHGSNTEQAICTRAVGSSKGSGLAGTVTTINNQLYCIFNTTGSFAYTKKKTCDEADLDTIRTFCGLTVQAGSGVAGVLSCNPVARSTNSSRITCSTQEQAIASGVVVTGSNNATGSISQSVPSVSSISVATPSSISAASVSTISVATPSSISNASVSSVTVSSISNASVSSISNASVSSVTVSSISNASVSSVTVSSISNASVSSITVSSISNASVSSVTVSSISNASVSSLSLSSASPTSGTPTNSAAAGKSVSAA